MTSPMFLGYLDDDYLDDPYLGGSAFYSFGMQVQRVITGARLAGMEVDRSISTTASQGMEVDRVIGVAASSGMEVARVNAGAASPGMEVGRVVLEDGTGNAMEIRMDHSISHWLVSEYLTAGYLTTPYLVRGYRAQTGWEVSREVAAPRFIGMELNRIVRADRSLAVEVERVVQAGRPAGMEVARTIRATASQGMEVDRAVRASRAFGAEVLRIIRSSRVLAMEIDRTFANGLGMQVRIVLYNTDKLRILSEFASRGADSVGGGNNAWGYPRGTGQNWVADTTATGDFSALNLNTDIVEQVWRATIKGGIVACDTEINQGVSVDTLGILNHNLTSSAIVAFEGSNDPGFSPVGVSIGVQVTPVNMYYIAPTFPVNQYRYWRLVISDSTNPSNIQIGTIVFGTSNIFLKEDIVDEITRRNKHFADKISTEGFTNVSNDRALKRAINISIQDAEYNSGDLNTLFKIFDTDRTSLKCLWIPDPQDPSRFAVFGKLAALPDERHKKMGPGESDTVSLTIEVDESL